MENDNIGHTGIKDGGCSYPNPCRNTQKAYLWGSSASLGTHIPQSAPKSLQPKPEHRPTSCPAFSLYLVPHWGWDLPEGGVWSPLSLLLPQHQMLQKASTVWEPKHQEREGVFCDGAREQPGLNLAPTMLCAGCSQPGKWLSLLFSSQCFLIG